LTKAKDLHYHKLTLILGFKFILMTIYDNASIIIEDLKSAISKLKDDDFGKAINLLSESSIGQHCRHIIEFYQCLMDQVSVGQICYDLRKRNMVLEKSVEETVNAIDGVISWLQTKPKNLDLLLIINHDLDKSDENHSVNSNLEREIVFNMEHCIHHMALIKIGYKAIAPQIELPNHFGVAPSTIRHLSSVAKFS
jgi:hypothetical protein